MTRALAPEAALHLLSRSIIVGDSLETRAKADLAHRIVNIIEGKKLTQVQAGRLPGVDQPNVSALMRGRLTEFSMERLLRFLFLLRQDVRITITPSRKRPKFAVQAVRVARRAASASRR